MILIKKRKMLRGHFLQFSSWKRSLVVYVTGDDTELCFAAYKVILKYVQ